MSDPSNLSLESVIGERAISALREALPALASARSCLALSAFGPLVALTREPADFVIDFAATAFLGTPVVVAAPRGSDRLHGLSPRRREVALLVAEGLSNRSIAARLGISIATVKDHVHAVLDSLGLASRHELIAAILAGRWEGYPPPR